MVGTLRSAHPTVSRSPLLRRNISQSRRMRGDLLDAEFQMHPLVRWQLLGDAHAGPPLGARPDRPRDKTWGTRRAGCSLHSPRRTCTRKSRYALPLRVAEGPCRNIRSSAGVAAPWSSRDVWTRRTIANQARDANGESPSISAMPVSFPRCAIAHRGTESILPMVLMESRLARFARAPE